MFFGGIPMKALKVALAACVVAAAAPAVADDHDDQMLNINQIKVKMGHHMAFREGVMAWKKCYAEAGGEGEWSAWRSVDGALMYHVVSTMDNWAELDEDDEAGMACYSVVEESIAPHMDSSYRMFVRRMADWSPAPSENDNTVVRLYNFKVENDWQFRAAVSGITGMMKATKSESQGTWYDVLGGGAWDADYFVVAGYKDFAAMDVDREDGPYGTAKSHAGEGTADLLFTQMRGALKDVGGRWTTLLSWDEDLSSDD
jgi:hypothetical protein